MSGLILLIPLLAVMYFLLIRPQQQRIRAQQEAIRSVQVGDEVVTAAGLIGRIVDLDDEVVHLEIADGVEVRVARMAIGRRLADSDVVTTASDDEDVDDEDVDLLEAEADAEDEHEPVDEPTHRLVDPDQPGNGNRPGPREDR